jgi:hypothetical protein
MELFYKAYNMLPEFLRKVIYAVFFLVVSPFILLSSRLKQLFFKLTNKTVREFAGIYLKVNAWLFLLFVILGLSFYFDGLHQKSLLPTLLSNLRIEVILIALFISSSIYYSRKYFNMPYSKGVSNGSYTKKK